MLSHFVVAGLTVPQKMLIIENLGNHASNTTWLSVDGTLVFDFYSLKEGAEEYLTAHEFAYLKL